MAGALLERGELALTRFVDARPGRSIAVETFAGPPWSWRHDADVLRPAASLLKVPLAIAVHRAAATRRARPRLPTSASTNCRRHASRRCSTCSLPEHELTLRELCGFVVATSDNRAANHLLALVGREAVDDTLRAAGCTESRMAVGFADDELGPVGRANVTTAADMLELLRFLHDHEDLGEVVHAMERNPLNARIPLRLPDDGRIAIANKTGSLAGVVDDVALIREGDLVLAMAVLCDGQDDNPRTGIEIGDCPRDVWAGVGGRLDP